MLVKMSGSKGRKDVERSSFSSSSNFRNVMVNNSDAVENETTDDQSLKSSVGIYRDLPKLNGKLSVNFEQEYSDTCTDNLRKTANNFFDAVSGEKEREQLLDRLRLPRKIMKVTEEGSVLPAASNKDGHPRLNMVSRHALLKAASIHSMVAMENMSSV